MQGTVFDIKEFSLHDGPGIRKTVFLKGCPLRCIWCHNPEGLSPMPELYVNQAKCRKCGLCRRPCSHSDCLPFDRCLHACPENLVRVSGRIYGSRELAELLLADVELLNSSGGGITVSGGEPLLQHEFTAELLEHLGGKVHRALETSGFASPDVFEKVTDVCDYVMMDVKLADPELHRKYTGVDNAPIIENLHRLRRSGKAHLFRVPLIPDITDTDENLSAIAGLVGDSPIELLPYNPLAGAKYKNVGREYTELITSSRNREIDTSFFENARMAKRDK